MADWIWFARIEGKGVPRLQLEDQPAEASRSCGMRATIPEDGRMIRLVDGYGEDDLEEVSALPP